MGICIRTLAASAIASFLAAWATTSSAYAQTCTPFGNPPRQLITKAPKDIPKCPGGKLLGPSNDSDGTARYSCLYEPKTASSTNPLPLVIYIHPSLTDADSISLTGLLKVLSSAN